MIMASSLPKNLCMQLRAVHSTNCRSFWNQHQPLECWYSKCKTFVLSFISKWISSLNWKKRSTVRVIPTRHDARSQHINSNSLSDVATYPEIVSSETLDWSCMATHRFLGSILVYRFYPFVRHTAKSARQGVIVSWTAWSSIKNSCIYSMSMETNLGYMIDRY